MLVNSILILFIMITLLLMGSRPYAGVSLLLITTIIGVANEL